MARLTIFAINRPLLHPPLPLLPPFFPLLILHKSTNPAKINNTNGNGKTTAASKHGVESNSLVSDFGR